MGEPRHVRARDKVALRALLVEPIRAYEVTAGRSRDLFVNQELKKRFDALFALYDISEDFDESVQWEMLARALADEYVRGCQVLLKGDGGPSEERREKQRDLFRKCKAYEAASRLKGSDARRQFWNKHRKECAEAGFTKERSFVQAVAEFVERYPDAVEVKLPHPSRRLEK